MAKIQLKERAQKLRKKGESIGNIAEELGISKSTASLWCRDIPLTQTQIAILHKKKTEAGVRGLLAAAEIKRTERMLNEKKLTSLGSNDVKKVSVRDLYMIGLGLYWGEGYKSGNDELGFTNSDPAMIRIFIRWLTKIYSIETTKLIFRISINKVHQKRIAEVTKFWIDYLHVAPEQFTKPSFIQTSSKKVYPNSEKYYGTLRVKVRNGVNLRRRILGSLARLKQ